MRRCALRWTVLATTMALVCAGAGRSTAYPVDATERTGILRLEAYDIASRGESRGKVIPRGALLPEEKVRLRLVDQPRALLDQLLRHRHRRAGDVNATRFELERHSSPPRTKDRHPAKGGGRSDSQRGLIGSVRRGTAA